jgi:uncharacterized protein YyaL (SSP411 family)
VTIQRWAADDAWESEDGQFIHEHDHDKAVTEAYRRGRADGKATVHDYDCTCDRLRAAYQRGFREGYNAHARAAQHWQDTHGAYRQHGEGENP